MSSARPQPRSDRVLLIASAILLAIVAAGAAVAMAQHPLVAIAGAAAVPVGAVLLVRRDAPAALFFFVLFLNLPAVAANFHGVPKTVAAASIGLLCIPAFRYIVARRDGIVFPRVAIWMGMFQLVQIVGILVSARQIEALLHVLQSCAEGFAMFLLIVNAVRTKTDLRTALLAAMFAGGAAGAVTVHQAVTKSYYANYGGLAQMSDTNVLEKGIENDLLLRHGGPIGEKNRFAQVLLITLPFGLAWLAPGSRRWLPAAIGLSMFMLAGVVLTRSRGGVLAAGAMLFAFIVIRRVPIRVLLALALLSVPAVGIVGAQYLDRMGSIADVFINASAGSFRTADAATRGRLNEMGSAVMMFFDHPMTGVGPDMYRHNYRRYAGSIGLHVHNTERGAHCMWLQVAAEYGAPGLLLFLTFCWMTASQLYSSLRATTDDTTRWLLTALLVSLLGYFASATFLSFTFIRYFWCILALCWCGIHVTQLEAEANQAPATAS